MNTTLAEKRIYDAIELRAEKVNGIQFLHGRAVPYGEPADVGWYLEEHEAGSLAKSLKEAARGLPLLMFHDSRRNPIGVAAEWDDNAEGLDGIWKLDSSDEAQEAARLATPDADGDAVLGYMSIGFAPIRSEWTFVEDFNPDLGSSHKDRVLRKESRLLEVSLVPAPAFVNASVKFTRTAERQRAVKDPQAEAKAWRAELDKIRG